MTTRRYRILAPIAAVIAACCFASCYPNYGGPPYDSYQYAPGVTTYGYGYGGYVGRPYYYDNYYYGSSDYYYHGNGYRKDRIKRTGDRRRYAHEHSDHPRHEYQNKARPSQSATSSRGGQPRQGGQAQRSGGGGRSHSGSNSGSGSSNRGGGGDGRGSRR